MKMYWLIIPLIALAIVVIGVLAYLYFNPPPEKPLYPPELRDILSRTPQTLNIVVDEFENNSWIPKKYTCDGPNTSPMIRIRNIPSDTVSLVIIVYDPDAPHGFFYHWIIYNVGVNGSEVTIPPDIGPSSNIGVQLRNDFNEIGYGGPCPPPGHGIHRYVFIVFALDSRLDVVDRSSLFNALKDHALAYGVYIGLYKR